MGSGATRHRRFDRTCEHSICIMWHVMFLTLCTAFKTCHSSQAQVEALEGIEGANPAHLLLGTGAASARSPAARALQAQFTHAVAHRLTHAPAQTKLPTQQSPTKCHSLPCIDLLARRLPAEKGICASKTNSGRSNHTCLLGPCAQTGNAPLPSGRLLKIHANGRAPDPHSSSSDAAGNSAGALNCCLGPPGPPKHCCAISPPPHSTRADPRGGRATERASSQHEPGSPLDCRTGRHTCRKPQSWAFN